MKDKIKKYLNKKNLLFVFSAVLLLLAGGIVSWIIFQETQAGSSVGKTQAKNKTEVAASQNDRSLDENVVITNKDEAKKEFENMNAIVDSLDVSDLDK